jgi:hypothetical protein
MKKEMTIKECIEEIIDYLYSDEKKDYETSPIKNHIFLRLIKVKDWIESPSCPLVDKEEL